LRYFIYAGITAMLRLIIVNHESSVDTILFAGAILIMVMTLPPLAYRSLMVFIISSARRKCRRVHFWVYLRTE